MQTQADSPSGPPVSAVHQVMINAVAIGQTYFMGSSFNPETCVVTHLVGFADLPPSTQFVQETLGRQHGYDPRSITYVGFESKRKHDPGTSFYCILAQDVFAGCAFESVDALCAARAAACTGAGLLRCTLPGDR
jgi:hypothetical protein